jgi:hypothetical protein
VLCSGFSISEVVSGACGIDADDPRRMHKPAKGGDGLGEMWAKANGIPICRFYPAWNRMGKKAGFIRNEEMAQYADALIALPGGSRTAHMIRRARTHGLETFVLMDKKKR